jgi:hypothetical protein
LLAYKSVPILLRGQLPLAARDIYSICAHGLIPTIRRPVALWLLLWLELWGRVLGVQCGNNNNNLLLPCSEPSQSRWCLP